MDAHTEQPAQVRGQRAAFNCASRFVLLGRPAFRHGREAETLSDTQKLTKCTPKTVSRKATHQSEEDGPIRKASNPASKLRTIQ